MPPASTATPLRGEIYFVSLDPVFGWEIGGFKLRPVVIVSINDISNETRMATVIPGTSSRKRTSLNNVVVVQESPDNGLSVPTQFQCHQIRAIERGRFTGRAIGRLSRDDFARIEKAMAYCLGLAQT
jgi:mRNA-degrading endonuclease toxin of MazEF toxin-antitoxin module